MAEGSRDMLPRLAGEVAAMSRDRVQAAVRRRLAPAIEVVVAMGKRSVLEAMFAKAGIKDVRWVVPE
jgi:hypothetical protein